MGATDSLTLQQTTLGDTTEQNPPRTFVYNVSILGAAETEKSLLTTFPDVKSFSNKEVIVDFQALGTVGAQGEIIVEQNFGTGGAPTATLVTPFSFVFPTGTLQRVQVQFTVPNASGFSRGTDGNDSFSIGIRFPLNTLGTFTITNMALYEGNAAPSEYLYDTASETRYKTLQSDGGFVTGDVKFSYRGFPDSGWLIAQDQTIGSIASAAVTKGDDLRALFITI